MSIERNDARRPLLAACAALLASVLLGLPGSGCLNPRPEEVPGVGTSLPSQPEPISGPARDTCADPAAAGCDLAAEDLNVEPLSDDADEQGEPANLADPSAGSAAPADGEAADPRNADAGDGDGDGGTDVPADAGAP